MNLDKKYERVNELIELKKALQTELTQVNKELKALAKELLHETGN